MGSRLLAVIVLVGLGLEVARAQALEGMPARQLDNRAAAVAREVSPAVVETPGAVDSRPACWSDVPAVPPMRIWAEVDYMQWWLKAVCLKPPTLTMGSPTDAVPGAKGQPGTVDVIDEGEHKFQFKGANGLRTIVGVPLLDDQSFGMRFEGFVLERVIARQAFVSADGSPATYLPYQDPANVEKALPFTVPGVVNGASIAQGSTQLWGAEANFYYLLTAPRGKFLVSSGLLGGFRYLDLRDQVLITNELGLVGQPLARAVGNDNFTTHNQFYGPQVGLMMNAARGPISGEMQLKLAAGETHQVSEVSGSPLDTSTVGLALLPGPLLAFPSNIGRQSADRVTLVPEMDLKLRYEIGAHLACSLGYSLLYWNKVLCPGDQMDDHLNTTQLPGRGPVVGPKDPAPLFVHTDAFAQGFTLGLEVRY